MGLHRVRLVLQASFAAAAFVTLLSPLGAASGHSEAQYLGGTVRAIQPKALGTLLFGGVEGLRFHSSGTDFRLPYDRIRDYHFSDYHKPAPKVAGVHLPRVNLLAHDHVIELSFQDQDGSMGTASFRIDSRTRSTAEALLSERVPSASKTGGQTAGVKLPQPWWGDKYWKTNRNKSSWPDGSVDGSATVGGTK